MFQRVPLIVDMKQPLLLTGLVLSDRLSCSLLTPCTLYAHLLQGQFSHTSISSSHSYSNSVGTHGSGKSTFQFLKGLATAVLIPSPSVKVAL
jgi:hypothetical protein